MKQIKMINFPIPDLTKNKKLYELLLPFSRFKNNAVYEDKVHGHRIACLDASNKNDIDLLMRTDKATLAIHDPPYNFVAFDIKKTKSFIGFCEKWIDNSHYAMKDNSSLYIWLGADQKNHFEPLADFMIMMRDKNNFTSKSFITMRNQRGYGTQKNWMAVRQELLYYIKGNPIFNIEAEYTDIPKILRNGYYKKVSGVVTDNLERSKHDTIRAGNVWVDIQQVFYRMEENVSGCFAQKPIKCIDRIVQSGSNEGDIVIDFFAHSGATLLASEIRNRKCFTVDIDPLFCEIVLRRLLNYRENNKLGWQNSNPFEQELRELGIIGFSDKGDILYK